MKCLKCNSQIIDGCCIKCGYLENGNQINYKEIDRYEDLKLFNKNFDKINQNKNLLLIFILGPLYFSYMGYFFLGTVMGLIDYFLLYYTMNNILWIFGNSSLTIIYFLVDRLIYIVLSNQICILIDKIKIKLIKRKYKENYKDKLKEYKHHKYYLLFTLIIYYILILMFIISRGIKNGLL